MHEVGIIESTLAAAAGHAGGLRVGSLRLRIGMLTGVVPEALQHAFAVLRHGTCCEDAVLHIELVPGRARCGRCALAFDAGSLVPSCPSCGAGGAGITGGRELELSTLEVIEPCASTAAAP